MAPGPITLWNIHAETMETVRDFIFSSVAQLCLTLWDLMNCNTPGLPFHLQLLEFTQTHAHLVGDAIQPSLFWGLQNHCRC